MGFFAKSGRSIAQPLGCLNGDDPEFPSNPGLRTAVHFPSLPRRLIRLQIPHISIEFIDFIK
jgi:hypothetical protein